jgi:hypothetical protein
MAGDPRNVDIWQFADVYFDFTNTAPAPTDLTTVWDPLWKPAGLLNGDDGITEGRDENSEDTFAWGQILIRTVYSQHKRTLSVAMYEDNAVTFGLVNPGESTRTSALGVIHSEVYVPQRSIFRMAMEFVDGNKKMRRYIPTAELGEVSEIETTEATAKVYSATVQVYPDGNGKLWDEYKTDLTYVATP